MTGLGLLSVVVYYLPCLRVIVVPILPLTLLGNGPAAVVYIACSAITSIGNNAPSTVTAIGSHVRTQVFKINSSNSIPRTLPLGNGGTYVTLHVSWEWPSSSSTCSIGCSANTGVGNNALGGLVARSVPHAFLPTYQNVYPTESMMSVLPLRFSGESESELSEQFTDWIKQFELVVRISILLG